MNSQSIIIFCLKRALRNGVSSSKNFNPPGICRKNTNKSLTILFLPTSVYYLWYPPWKYAHTHMKRNRYWKKKTRKVKNKIMVLAKSAPSHFETLFVLLENFKTKCINLRYFTSQQINKKILLQSWSSHISRAPITKVWRQLFWINDNSRILNLKK